MNFNASFMIFNPSLLMLLLLFLIPQEQDESSGLFLVAEDCFWYNEDH